MIYILSHAYGTTKIEIYIHFYNNCLIFCALIGSFLSPTRVQTDKILIYAKFQTVNILTNETWLTLLSFWVANQKQC